MPGTEPLVRIFGVIVPSDGLRGIRVGGRVGRILYYRSMRMALTGSKFQASARSTLVLGNRKARQAEAGVDLLVVRVALTRWAGHPRRPDDFPAVSSKESRWMKAGQTSIESVRLPTDVQCEPAGSAGPRSMCSP